MNTRPDLIMTSVRREINKLADERDALASALLEVMTNCPSSDEETLREWLNMRHPEALHIIDQHHPEDVRGFELPASFPFEFEYPPNPGTGTGTGKSHSLCDPPGLGKADSFTVYCEPDSVSPVKPSLVSWCDYMQDELTKSGWSPARVEDRLKYPRQLAAQLQRPDAVMQAVGEIMLNKMLNRQVKPPVPDYLKHDGPVSPGMRAEQIDDLCARSQAAGYPFYKTDYEFSG